MKMMIREQHGTSVRVTVSQRKCHHAWHGGPSSLRFQKMQSFHLTLAIIARLVTPIQHLKKAANIWHRVCSGLVVMACRQSWGQKLAAVMFRLLALLAMVPLAFQ